MHKIKLLFLALIYFPGTVLHEASHYLFAKLLFVKTGRVSLLPHFTEHGIVLGSVQIAKVDFVRRFLVGVAPLIVGSISLFFVVYTLLTRQLTLPIQVLFIYFLITILNTMTLSKSDLVGAWKVIVLLVLAITFVIAIHWII